MEPAETYEHAGMTVEIHYDEDSVNPRTDFDGQLGVMFCDYDRYELGDYDAPDPRNQTVTCDKCDGEGRVPNILPDGLRSTLDPYIECERCEGSGEVESPIIEYLQREYGARVVLPLVLYDHSGITMRVGSGWRSSGQFVGDDAGWDTSLVGVIFDTAETRDAYAVEDWTDEQIEKSLRAEVAQYDSHLTGECYGYIVKFPSGEEYDSCWGFLGDIDYCRKEANAVAECGSAELESRRESVLVRGEN